MAKFRKDGGKNKNKNVDFKKKVKVGRKVKKANETVPQVKVGRIIIKDQLSKLDDDFVKLSSSTEVDTSMARPSHTSLLEIKKKIISELKMCAPDVKPSDKKKFLEKVRRALEISHCDLTSLVMKVVLERICCPLLYEKNGEIRVEVYNIINCLITKYIETSNGKHGMFLLTSQSCPIFSVSICRALSDPECCLDAIKIVGLACDLCPMLIQSESINILQKLITLLYRQSYFQINHSVGTMKARNTFLDSDKLFQKTNSLRTRSWSLPKLIVDCNSDLLLKPAREMLLNHLSKVFMILSQQVGKCEYLAHPNNISDVEESSRLHAEVSFEILCATWRDAITTATRDNNTLTFNFQSFTLITSILNCMKTTIQFVHANCSSGELFSSWLRSEIMEMFEDSVGSNSSYSIYRRSNKNKELDESSTINATIEDINTFFTEYES